MSPEPAGGGAIEAAKASDELPAAERRLRFGGGVGGVYVPGSNVWAVTVEGYVTIVLNPRWELRPVLMYVHTEDDYTATNAVGAGILPTFWFGKYYGVALGTLFSYAYFTRKSSGGWDDSSVILIAFAEPLRVRFGDRVRHELSLELGTGFVFTHSSQLLPWGKIAYTILF